MKLWMNEKESESDKQGFTRRKMCELGEEET